MDDPSSQLRQAASQAELYTDTGNGAGTPQGHRMEDRLARAARDCSADAVVDLSDAPVLSYEDRFRLASRMPAEGLQYVGSDYSFSPPDRVRVFSKPSISVVGTGKRIGKTAVSIHLGRLLKDVGFSPVTVTMGRGGHRKPELIQSGEDEAPVDRLLRVAEEGKHAASDYWEDAILSGLRTIGCRRCGGGLFGSPFDSNVVAGARMAESTESDIVIVEGSGPTLPPVFTDATILVSGAGSDIQETLAGPARYRLLGCDLLVLTGCEPPFADPATVRRVDEWLRRERNVLENAGDILYMLLKADVDLVLLGHRHYPNLHQIENTVFLNAGTASSSKTRYGDV